MFLPQVHARLSEYWWANIPRVKGVPLRCVFGGSLTAAVSEYWPPGHFSQPRFRNIGSRALSPKISCGEDFEAPNVPAKIIPTKIR